MGFLKKFHWFELAIILLVMGVHLYGAFSAPHNFPSRWFTRDDAFYYFKVAQNISEGHGSTFDGLNLTNGYHPLWMIVCIPIFALARFDLILPLRVLILVMAALSAATSILLFRLLKGYVQTPVAMLAAAFWAFSLEVHAIVTQQGMETGLVALSLLVFLYLLQKLETKPILTPGDFARLGLAALFVVFSRLDGVFFVLVAGLWIIFRRHPLRYLLPVDLLLTAFIIVGAYIQRAGLKFYLQGFDNSAILMAALAFAVQTIIFYFIGLYTHPRSQQVPHLLLISVIGVTISVLLSTLLMLVLTALGFADMPRAVPAIYWAGLLLAVLLTRFGLRGISPWPVTLTRENKPVFGFLAGRNQIRVALEPLAKWWGRALRYFGVAGLGLLVYMLSNRLMFGTFMPVSGQIKRWWGSIPNDVYGGGARTFLDVYEFDPTFSDAWGLFTYRVHDWAQKLAALGWNFYGWFALIILAGIAVWLGLFLQNRKRNLRRVFRVGIIPLVISAELHAFFYGAMAYAAKQEWYWVMPMLALVILGALGLSMLIDILPRVAFTRWAAWGLTGAASLALAWSFSVELITRMPYTDPLAGQAYMDTLPILEGYTPPGAYIGMTGGGNTGYFIHDRTIINMDGLINSYAYFQALKTNRGGTFLSRLGMDYVFANKYIMTNTMPYRYQFSVDELQPVPDAPVYGQKELLRYTPAQP